MATELKTKYNEPNSFVESFGGTAQMGEALRRGMVLVLSIWTDSSVNMNWLDSWYAGLGSWQAVFGEKGK